MLSLRVEQPLGNGDAIASAWTDYLSRWRWDWFTTLTFREEIHPEAADKLYRVWVAMLNRQLYGKRWFKHGRGLYYARAIEYQRRGVIHFHSLVGGENLASAERVRWAREWNTLAGYAWIEIPRAVDAVARYASKYTTKGGEIDLGGRLQDGYAAAPSVL